ncbi:hypothetical protein OWV82_017759 [Melia azedarach]|uniref:Uncharacterized protein n=1 Tax=Melia azedarach TaxID=155640 RepID=A0ACC1XAB7_MELAZ|nr:hypothetical protein OWV82_017759 [Melia azedarach]
MPGSDFSTFSDLLSTTDRLSSKNQQPAAQPSPFLDRTAKLSHPHFDHDVPGYWFGAKGFLNVTENFFRRRCYVVFVSGVKECSPVPAKACSKICEPLRWPAKQRLLRSLSPSLRLMTDEASKQRVNFCARRMVRGRWV